MSATINCHSIFHESMGRHQLPDMRRALAVCRRQAIRKLRSLRKVGGHVITLNTCADTLVRYDNLSLEACLSGAHFQRCRLPGCSSGQQCFPEEDSYMICRECGGRTCIACDTEWHPNVSCTDMAARRAEERNGEETAAQQYLSANSKMCPHCHIRGQKVRGCDHMSCKESLTSFYSQATGGVRGTRSVLIEHRW